MTTKQKLTSQEKGRQFQSIGQAQEAEARLVYDPNSVKILRLGVSIPKGTPLQGFYKDTYWSHEVKNEQNTSLSESLEKFLMSLVPYKDFLHEIHSTGGRMECFIGWFSGSNSGEVFDNALLSLFGDLRVDLALDVYGQSDHLVEIITESNE
jgi:hypothetical protein